VYTYARLLEKLYLFDFTIFPRGLSSFSFEKEDFVELRRALFGCGTKIMLKNAGE